MALPTSKKQFKDYVLRKLGAPVIQINVSDEQVDDRIDEALSFFADYHYNGSEHVYLKHQLTAADLEQGYIDITDIADYMIGVTRIFDLNTSVASGAGMWNVNYQFALNNMHEMSAFGLQNYFMTMQHLEFIREILVGKPMIRYNRLSNHLKIDVTKSSLVEGSYIIIEGYAFVSGDEYERVWSDRWLQNYASVLIREQWGNNITKFINVQLTGGVQFNGEQILSAAVEERHKLEQEAIAGLQPLVYSFVG